MLLAFAANRFAASVISNAEHEIAAGDDLETLERRKRLRTVGATLRRFFSVLIWSAAALMVLRELDVDITPVLTGAGIIGLAVGFGAQTLVKDIISGLFLIAEDQVRIGDVARDQRRRRRGRGDQPAHHRAARSRRAWSTPSPTARSARWRTGPRTSRTT